MFVLVSYQFFACFNTTNSWLPYANDVVFFQRYVWSFYVICDSRSFAAAYTRLSNVRTRSNYYTFQCEGWKIRRSRSTTRCSNFSVFKFSYSTRDTSKFSPHSSNIANISNGSLERPHREFADCFGKSGAYRSCFPTKWSTIVAAHRRKTNQRILQRFQNVGGRFGTGSGQIRIK